MSELAFLKTDKTVQNEENFLGGKKILSSAIYDFVINMAYFDVSKGGANSLNLLLSDSDGNELKTTLWITSGTAKGCKNFFTTRDGTKKYLPGFNQANSICMLSIGKEISKADVEKKTVKVYDPAEGKEVNREKTVITELIGGEISCGVVKQIVDMNVKNDQGAYVPSGKTREENEIDKCFRTEDYMTVAELRAKETEPKFKAKWLEKNLDQTRDKSTGKADASAPAASTGGSAPAATESLFDD